MSATDGKTPTKVIHQHDTLAPDDFLAAPEQAKAQIIHIGIAEAPSLHDEKGKEQKREAQNMAERFRKHAEAYFQFITTPGMDPTNNVAEQAIRFIVIDRHVTQGTRSAKGRRATERLWTVIATCELQGRSAFEFILQAVRAYFYEEPPPSLLPDPP
jgi:transposase